MAEQSTAAVLPQDALLAKEVLESMGVNEYEPKVLQQLMDFMYRYISEILQDAEAIRERVGGPRGEVSLPDVMMAVQSRAQYSFVQPPSQQVLAGIAAQHNQRPLPELRPDRYGLRLPPEGDCLLAPNYQLQPHTPEGMPPPPPQQQPPQPPPQLAKGAVSGSASRGQNIQIRAPAQLPEGTDEGGQGGEGWAEVPPAGQGGDDIDMGFEDI